MRRRDLSKVLMGAVAGSSLMAPTSQAQSSCTEPCYPLSAGEAAAGVTPTNYAYPPGDARRHGAVGDGSTDDTTALRNWMKSARKLYLPRPSSYYKITNAIPLESDRIIEGDGYASMIRITTADTSIFAGSAVSQIVIRNLGFYGIATLASAFHAGINLANCNDVLVDGCEFQNFSFMGVVSQSGNSAGGKRIRVRNCYMHGWVSAQNTSCGIGFLDNSQDCEAAGNTLDNTGWVGVVVQDTNSTGVCLDIKIVDNTSKNQLAYGIACYFVAAAPRRLLIEGNNIDTIDGAVLGGTAGAGIYCQGCSDVRIVGNQLRNTCVNTTTLTLAPAAIGLISHRGDHTIIGNTIDTPNWYGIYCVSQVAANAAVAISGNTITNHKKVGIHVVNCEGITITSNTLRADTVAVGTRSILVNNSSLKNGYVISNNNCRSNSSRAIEVIRVTDLTFSGNQLVGAGTAVQGLTFDTCARVSCTGNDINLGTSATGQALIVNATTEFRATGNQFRNVGSSEILLITGTCSNGHIDKSNYWNSTLVNNSAGSGIKLERIVAASPTTGSHSAGDTVWFMAPAAASPPGAICTVSGAAAVFVYKTMAAIAT